MTSITAPPQRLMRKRPVMAALGTAFVIAAVAAGGFWLAVGRDDPGNAGAIVAPQPAPAAVAGGDSIAPVQAREQMAFYLVASQDEADQILSGIEQSNVIRNGEGLASLEAQVFVISSPADMEWARQAIKDEADYRAAQGLPGVTVSDLRVTHVPGPAEVYPEGATSGDLTPVAPAGRFDPADLP